MNLLSMVPLVLAPFSGQEAFPSRPTSRDVLLAMLNAYNSAQTYKDEAEFKLIDDATKPKEFRVTRLRTYFQRPETLRLDMERASPDGKSFDRMVMWNVDGKCRSWWSRLPSIQDHVTVQDGIWWAREVSQRGTYMPTMLLSEAVPGWRPSHRRLTYPKVEVVDGRSCYRVNRAEASTIYWIDCETFVLRKLWRRIAKTQIVRSDLILTYRPQLNPKLPPQVFLFSPPSGR